MNEHAPPARKPGPNTVAGEQTRGAFGKWAPDDNRRQLTEFQAKFAVAYVENGGIAEKAARTAGYTESSARTHGPALVRLPWVARAIEVERKRLLNEAGVAALHYVAGIIRDTGAEKRLRLKAAEVALKAVAADRDGQKDSSATGKALSAMTVAELEALVRRLDQAAELAQQPILEHDEQSDPPITTQPIDNAGESTVL